MLEYTVHTEESAPEGSKLVLKQVKAGMGFVPNLMATLSESPASVAAYSTLMSIFEKSDFTPTEKQVVLMTNNRLNGCYYCMAAHSTVSKMQGVSDSDIETLRNGTSFGDPKLEAIRVFTEQVFHTRGNVSDVDVDAFIGAGYTKGNVLEVVLGTGLKVLSNYSHKFTKAPVDKAFEPMAWSPDQVVSS